MLYSGPLVEENIGRHTSKIWWAYYDTFWQHQCNSSDAFQDQAYSYQVSLSKGESHRKQYQAIVCWDKGTYCRHLRQTTTLGDIWVYQT